MKKEFESTILLTIDRMISKPRMYISNVNFNSLSTLLVGYFVGIKDFSGIDYNSEISKWLNEHYSYKSSVGWTEYIHRFLAEEDNEKAYNLLLTSIIVFFELEKRD